MLQRVVGEVGGRERSAARIHTHTAAEHERLRGDYGAQLAAMSIAMGTIERKAGVYRHHRNLFLFALLPAICIPLASTTRSEKNDTKVEREGDEALVKTICGDDG